MAEETIEKERSHLDKQIRMRLDEYFHWWQYNSRRKNWLFSGNIACSLGAAISGVYDQAHLAGVFGAVLTALFAIQKHYPLDQEATWYGVAVSRCKVLLNKTHSSLATIESLSVVGNDLNTLIAEEGEKTKTLANQKGDSKGAP